eukprot:GEMP01028101.1.p1 GENE.GEMP01028101.1~~GEMP01028101.1.p1  ORF type:complete len:443 (+),score=94.34 GEMP01028101.1:126-1454(+)
MWKSDWIPILGGHYEGESDLQLQRISVHYDEVPSLHASAGDGSRYVPRSILCDLDPVSMDNVRAGPYGSLFSPDDYIFGKQSACNNYATGHYVMGADICELAMDRIRIHAGQCDSLHAFQLIHSLGGGTGSGLGSRLLGQIREEYPDRMFLTCTVFPAEKVSDTVVEPYNATLALNHLVENADMTMVMDNEALYDICHRVLKIQSPTFGDLNYVVSAAMSGITACTRFPGQLNCDLRKMCVNTVCFPRLHFLLTSFAPFIPRGSALAHAATVPELTDALFDPTNVLCSVDPRRGKYMSAGAIFRGKHISSSEVEGEIFDMRSHKSDNFVEWLPNNFKLSLCDVPQQGFTNSATMIGNTTAVKQLITRTSRRFSSLWRRKAYFQWYLSEGMDEQEFTEAESNMNDLVSEYQQYEDATFEDSDYEDSEGFQYDSDEDESEIEEC